MKDLKSIFKFDATRVFSKRNKIIAFALIIISILFLWEGKSEYIRTVNKKKSHIEMEHIRFNGHIFYTQYASRGIKTIFLPSTLSVLFNNTKIFNDLTAKVDTSEKLRIYSGMKGPHLFARWTFFDFSGVLYFVGTLLAMLFGYSAFRNREVVKYLKRRFPNRNIYLYVSLSRIVFYSLFYLVLITTSIIFCLANGIELPVKAVLYFISMELIFILFILVGGGIGLFKTANIYWLIGIYISTLILLPYIVSLISKLNANNIASINEIEKEKYLILSNFEKKGREIASGKYDSRNVAPTELKEYIKSYLEKEYPAITEKEEMFLSDIESRINLFEWISTPIPTCFQMALNYEFSGNGYLELLAFCRYNQKFKDNFFKFYIDKKFFSSPGGKVESFVKEDEKYIYVSSSKLPSTIIIGILNNIFWVAVAMVFGLLKFRKCFMATKSEYDNEIEKVERTPGIVSYVLTKSHLIRRQIFDFFSDFVYLPSPAVFGKNGLQIWKKTFSEALERDKAILADIDDIGDNNTVINIVEISRIVKEENAVFIAVGEDYYIYRNVAGKPILIKGDKSVVLNCIMDG